ncbi:hypothetical protein NTJ56_20830 [Burkholderia contaminans]|uniref:hypothetical protein n=1 Tax=Burkholderia contaminans TaxID=488447 RepID=UPI001CF1829C|nr:hypothetical protein [Burkholderia contaminans]MCA7915714.1 hypothetical protein [Burkholderia contaminans]UUX40883.1 hypothetical protein NTJ56_20830 [Burkholderia contaminans]
MEQYTLKEISAMSFAQLGAVDDPMLLMACGSMGPILVRYVIRTGQLDARYQGVALPVLLDAILLAASNLPWPPEVGQQAPLAKQSAEVDAYLDSLQPHLQSALRPH